MNTRWVQKEEVCVFADDLRDYVPPHQASPARVYTNALAMELAPHEYGPLRASRRLGSVALSYQRLKISYQLEN